MNEVIGHRLQVTSENQGMLDVLICRLETVFQKML